MLLPILALFVLGALISAPLTKILIALGHRARAMDSPGSPGHRKALRPVPNIGGVAIYVAVAAPLAAGLLLLELVTPARWREVLPAVADLLERREGDTAAAAALLGSITVLHVVGLIDDRRGLGPLVKLAPQVIAALVLAIWFDVRLLTVLGPAGSIAVSVLWIVAVTNAMNFIDNMDGLAAGVGAIAGGLFLAATIVNHQWFIAATLALLVGALAGFLIFNFPPARIFMGDGGSLVVGFLLGVLTVRTTFFAPEADYALGSAWYGVFMPVVVLAVPLYDLVTVTWIRLRQKRSPFVGDQQHFSHRLVQRGLSRRGAVILIWSATAVTGIGGIGLGRLSDWQAVLVGVQTAAVLLMLVVLEHTTRHVVRRDGGTGSP